MHKADKYKSFDEIKCLWIKSGALEYKICDKNFECEACEYAYNFSDKERTEPDINEELNRFTDPFHLTVPFTHPHYHYQCGLIVKNFLRDNYYLGFEPFISRFIDHKSDIKYTTDEANIRKNKPIVSIKDGWGEMEVLSPFNFRYVEKLDLKNTLLEGNHWFSIVEAERQDIVSNSIDEQFYNKKFCEIKSFLRESLDVRKKTGIVMYDGGSVIINWFDIMRGIRYKELMAKLFS